MLTAVKVNNEANDKVEAKSTLTQIWGTRLTGNSSICSIGSDCGQKVVLNKKIKK